MPPACDEPRHAEREQRHGYGDTNEASSKTGVGEALGDVQSRGADHAPHDANRAELRAVRFFRFDWWLQRSCGLVGVVGAGARGLRVSTVPSSSAAGCRFV